jgi:hypothetical protein
MRPDTQFLLEVAQEASIQLLLVLVQAPGLAVVHRAAAQGREWRPLRVQQRELLQ